MAKWRDQFVEGGVAALANGSRGPSSREVALEQEVTDLTQALGEVHVELRVVKRGKAQGFGTRSWR